MKYATLIFALFCSAVVAQEKPADYKKLQDLRKLKIEELNKQYVEALKNLKTKYTKKGNLEVALMIDKEIKSYDTKIKSSTITKEVSNENSLEGTEWHFLGVNKQVINTMTLAKGGDAKCEHSYLKATWKKIDEKHVLFSYDGTEESTIIFTVDDKGEFMSGKNKSGKSRYLRKIK